MSGPRRLQGGPVGKLLDGDIIRIRIDCRELQGSVDLVGEDGAVSGMAEGTRLLAARPLRSDLSPHPGMPADTRLWAALQACSGGTWNGCVYDVDAIVTACSAACECG